MHKKKHTHTYIQRVKDINEQENTEMKVLTGANKKKERKLVKQFPYTGISIF